MATDIDYTVLQKSFCKKFGAAYYPVDLQKKVGLSRGFLKSNSIFNGIRLEADSTTTGWFMWGDEEVTDSDDFFVPFHAVHLIDYKPQTLKFMALPLGWRFYAKSSFEDAWFDHINF